MGITITSVEEFKKIRAISEQTLNSRHRILLNDLLAEILIPQDSLLVLLIELENRGLVKIHNTTVVSVEDPLGGLNSEG